MFDSGFAPRPLPEALKAPAWAGTLAAGGSVPDGDVIISSRARLARNLADFPFPAKATDSDLRRIAQRVRQAAHADTERLFDLHPVEIATLSLRDRSELVDARRISPDLAIGGVERYALLDNAGTISLFVNEEDHLRLQTLAAGNAPDMALLSVQDVEARLARRLTWAADHERWGYLTASLSNVGTGLRLSVLAHLPALVFLDRLDRVFDAAKRLGISVRGAHGEHSSVAGDLFQISNAETFGVTPENIAGRIRSLTQIIVQAERAARRDLGNDTRRRGRVNNAAKTAWEHIETADKLSARDALECLTRLRLSAACGLKPWGQRFQFAPAPNDQLYAHLLAELRTGAGLTNSEGTSALRDAIGRPALLRAALAPLYTGADSV